GAVGFGVGVAVGFGVGVAVGFGVGVAVGAGVGVAVGFGVGVAVGLGVGLGVAIGVGLGVIVSVALGVGFGVGVGDSSTVGLVGKKGVEAASCARKNCAVARNTIAVTRKRMMMFLLRKISLADASARLSAGSRPIPRSVSTPGNRQVLLIFILRPKMKGVAENNVAENVVRFIVRDVKRGIHLKVRRDVPGDSDRG